MVVYWRVLNIDGFIQWRFNWLCVQAANLAMADFFKPSPVERYLRSHA